MITITMAVIMMMSTQMIVTVTIVTATIAIPISSSNEIISDATHSNNSSILVASVALQREKCKKNGE